MDELTRVLMEEETIGNDGLRELIQKWNTKPDQATKESLRAEMDNLEREKVALEAATEVERQVQKAAEAAATKAEPVVEPVAGSA